MKIRHAAAAALAALSAGALTACKDDDPTFVEQAPLAYVRYVNASPDSPALTARLIDKVENWRTADGVAFRANSGNYYGANAGTRRLSVSRLLSFSSTIDTGAVVVLDTSFTIQAGTYYTIVQTGLVMGARGTAGNTAVVRVFADTMPAASSIGTSSVVLRAYNLLPTAGAVNVTATSNVAGSAAAATLANVAFGARSAYATVPVLAGTALYAFAVTPASSTTALFSATPSVPGLAAAAATTTTPPLARTAGVRQSQSVLSLFLFPPAVAGSPAAAAGTSTTANGADLVADQQPPS